MLDKGLVEWINANLTKQQYEMLNVYYNGIRETCKALGMGYEETKKVANDLMWAKVKTVKIKKDVA